MARQKGQAALSGAASSEPTTPTTPSREAKATNGVVDVQPVPSTNGAPGPHQLGTASASSTALPPPPLIDVQYLPLGVTDKARLLTLQHLTVCTPDRSCILVKDLSLKVGRKASGID